MFNNVSEALEDSDTQIRLFGKPSISGRRRLGVAISRGESIENAKEKAIKASSAVKIVL